MRETTAQFRETAGGAIRASWKAGWGKSLLFATGVGVFLGLVGAFDTARYSILQRLPVFTFIGAGSGLIVAACSALVDRIPLLSGRPLGRRVIVSMLVTPLSAVWVWLVISYMYLGGLKLWALTVSLGYTALLTGPMAVVSWLIFRPRIIHATPAPSPPKFLERLPFRLRDAELFGLEAEDHYLRVRTSKGSELVLMRFSDALAELEGVEGSQTHRSWWVAKAGVADVRRVDGRAVLILKDGAEAPVSRTHAKSLREQGWL